MRTPETIELTKKLKELTGYDNKMDIGLNEDELFVSITQFILEAHTYKNYKNGDYISNFSYATLSRSLIEHFSNIKRKCLKLERSVQAHRYSSHKDRDDLLKTYFELAMYSILGVQLVYKLTKENASKT